MGAMMTRWPLLLLLATAPAAAQVPPPDLATLQSRAARRFPQPVRVGDLIGRTVQAPSENQAVLGRVEAVVAGTDGRTRVVIRFGGVRGIGARLIAVPVEAMALLGDVVVAVDYTEQQLAALPEAGTEGALRPDTVVRMGLVKPYH